MDNQAVIRTYINCNIVTYTEKTAQQEDAITALNRTKSSKAGVTKYYQMTDRLHC